MVPSNLDFSVLELLDRQRNWEGKEKKEENIEIFVGVHVGVESARFSSGMVRNG